MILRILKSNQPINYFLIVLFGLLLWSASLMKPQLYSFFPGENENILFKPIHNLLENSLLAESIVSLLLLIVLAVLVQQLNNRFLFIRIRTMLPALMFVLMVGGYTQLHTLHPVYFAAIFLLIAIYAMFNTLDKSKPYSEIFNSGFWLAVGSLFYLNLILLLPAFLLGMVVLSREYRWRIFIINILGFLLPFFFAISYAILTEQFLELLKIFEQNLISANKYFESNFSVHIFLAFIIFLTLLGSIKIIQQYDSKKVSSRKYFTVFFIIFIFSMFAFFLSPSTSKEMLIIIAIPVCFLVSNLLAFMKSRFWSELIFTLLLGMVVFMQIMAF